MKTWIVTLVLTLTTGMATGIALADPRKAPMEVGGFTLGSSIGDYDMITYDNFVKEVVVFDVNGFEKAAITYGVCDKPGEIVRIKLKYKDRSFNFFKQLLKQYKNKFGDRPRYVGGSFGMVKAWKWAFENDKGQRVTLVLQHNLKDPDAAIGNVVKLNLPDQLIAERKCYSRTCDLRQKDSVKELPPPDWDLLLPK
jgi:hypothetical protein